MYILDTNILNILLYPSPERVRVRAKIKAVGDVNVWFSIITVHEKLFHGYLPAIHQGLNKPIEVRRWHDAKVLMDKFQGAQILDFTDTDYENFKRIYALVKKAGLDCRIAASALSRDWTAVTHNKADFDMIKTRVLRIKVEDWSIMPPS